MSHNIYTEKQIYKIQQRKINKLTRILEKTNKLQHTISSICLERQGLSSKYMKNWEKKQYFEALIDIISISDICSRLLGIYKNTTNFNEKEILKITDAFDEVWKEVENAETI